VGGFKISFFFFFFSNIGGGNPFFSFLVCILIFNV
jgi:hypothetical protein